MTPIIFTIIGWFAWILASVVVVIRISREQQQRSVPPRLPRRIIEYAVVVILLGLAMLPRLHNLYLDWRFFAALLLYLGVHVGLQRFVANLQARKWLRGLTALGILGWLASQVSVCVFIVCQPQPWAAQKAYVESYLAAQLPNNAVEFVWVDFVRDRAFWFSPAPELELHVGISTDQEVVPSAYTFGSSYRSFNLHYSDYDPPRTIVFDAQSNGVTSEPPSADIRAAWQRTQIGPREALAATEARGREFLGRAAEFREVMVTLSLNSSMPELAAHPTVWLVSYRDTQRDGAILEIWVDAENGTLIGERIF